MFAKYWTPGQVKTRLAPIGLDVACEVYRNLVLHLLNELAEVGDRRTLVFAPGERHDLFAAATPKGWGLCRQAEGDLGQRLKTFFAQQFALPDQTPLTRLPDPADSVPANRYPNLVVIGSDCPLIDAALIEKAFASLQRSSVVIGPSTDGGYYLIGMNLPHWELFENIHWSTNEVYAQTISILRKNEISFEVLPALTDVDELGDLIQLIQQLSDLSTENAAAKRLLQELAFLVDSVPWQNHFNRSIQH